jgi:hypothetical protein
MGLEQHLQRIISRFKTWRESSIDREILLLKCKYIKQSQNVMEVYIITIALNV